MDAHAAPGTSPDSPEIDPVQAAIATRRAGYIAGLRELADLLEQHPEVPTPYQGSEGKYAALSIHHLGTGPEVKPAFAATVRALPGSRTKDVRDGDYGAYFDVHAVLGGALHVKVTAYRDTVCERHVVGTREVELPAQAEQVIPAREATVQVIEDVEWVCTPVLA